MEEIKKLNKAFQNLDYLSTLNYEQKIAATAEDGNFLVLAGPGSGKTHTLIYRVLHLVRTGVDPKSIVIITFTRKAARELENRLFKMFNTRDFIGFVGTFHSFAHYIIKSHKAFKNSSAFKFIDTDDERVVLGKVKADNNIEFNNKFRLNKVVKINSYACNTMSDLQTAFEKTGNTKYIDDYDSISKLIKLYNEYKSENNMISFDDLLQFVTRFLTEHHSTLSLNFKYLMVDEYQDTNNLQINFIKAVGIQNIMAIGDDFQSIYRFRGADYKIILNFGNDFNNAKIIKLKVNYRSTQEIVSSINTLIKDAKFGYQKELISARKGHGKVNFFDGTHSHDVVKNTIDSSVKHKNKTHAFIYRANNDRIPIEKELISRNISYIIYGGIRMLERKHIKDVMAFAFARLNTQDALSYTRILTILPGVGEKTANQLMKDNLETKLSLNREASELLNEYKKLIYSNSYTTIPEFIRSVINVYTRYPELIESEYYSLNDINQDLDLLYELSLDYSDLHTYITEVILENTFDKESGKGYNVYLTTIHSAKGLEFDYVTFLYSISPFAEYSIDNLEEDRRLAYVAMSRAKYVLNIVDQGINHRSFKEFISYFNNEAVDNNFKYYNSPSINHTSNSNNYYSNKHKLQNNNEKVNINWIVTLFLTVFLGFTGIHRMVNGKPKTGILMLFTFGLCSVLWLVDIVIVSLGKFKDKYGNEITWFKYK